MQKKIAFLFPGQGNIPGDRSLWTDSGERLFGLAEESGVPLRGLLERGAMDRLSCTDYAQPVILIDSLIKDELLRKRDIKPAIAAGHSLGEYAALTSAGMLAAEDALSLVIERGRLMSKVAGGMTAIVRLSIAQVQRLCDRVGPGVVVANHNGPLQVVISGEKGAVDEVGRLAQNEGGRVIPLPVSGPFHSPLMGNAQKRLAVSIAGLRFHPCRIPVISGVSGTLETDPARMRQLLFGQITACVRWVDVVTGLEKAGVSHAVEVGPGDVLVGLGRRISKNLRFLRFEEAYDGGI